MYIRVCACVLTSQHTKNPGQAKTLRILPPEVPPRKNIDMTPKRSSVFPDNGEVVTVLHEITATLNTLVKRVESTETGLKVVQQKLERGFSTPSSSDSSPGREKVPNIVRVRNVCLPIQAYIMQFLSYPPCSQRQGRSTKRSWMKMKHSLDLILELSMC